MFKKVSSFFILLVLLTLIVSGCTPSSPSSVANNTETSDGQAKKLKVAFVLSGSISDGAFGTISYQGIQAVKKETFIEKADYIEGVTAATDAAKAIRDYVADGYDVVWAQSGAYGASVMEIAPQFPDSVFVALASPPSDQKFDNVWFSLSEYEGGYYIVGALAAKMTETNTIGFVGGRENPLYIACSKAYEEGAKSVNPDITVLTVFTGDFNDPIKAKEATVSQLQSGADIITHLQSLGMTGVFAAAEEATQTGKKVWVIGKDTDQFAQAPNVVMTSLVIDYGVQMKNILGEIADGKMSGSMAQSVTNGSVYLADFYGQVPSDVVAQIDELTTKVKKGEVKYTTQYDIK